MLFCSDATAGICTVEFFLPRIQFRAMTYATKIVELDVIFPKVLPENIISLSQAPHLQNCLDEIPQLQQLYDDQKQALEGMLHPELKHVYICYTITLSYACHAIILILCTDSILSTWSIWVWKDLCYDKMYSTLGSAHK